jgi:hypothetical protein
MKEPERAYFIKWYHFMDVIYNDLMENLKNNAGNPLTEQAKWQKENEMKSAKF